MSSNVNIKHKSSVFSTLFSDPDILRELYSAIEGIDVPEDAVININTLSDVLYMRQINDVSFIIDNRIVVLIEHQSTINDNVPVRLLMYIARVYEKILDREKLYQKKLVKIPTPELFVFYNGSEPFDDHKELRLSTAFKNAEGLKKFENNCFPLELIVQVYNINHGRNPQILNKSKTLGSYSFFIAKIKEFNKNLPLEESVKAAIKYCIENDILKQFLKNHSSEVINMLTDDLSVEEIVAVRSKEAWEDGHQEGLEDGREEAHTEARKYFIELLDQGLSINEIKQRLTLAQTISADCETV